MTEDLLRRLESRVRGYGSPQALVAFSGGVDSSTVLAVAARALGPDNVTAVTAVSPSYPEGELEAAGHLAGALGTPHRTIDTQEVDSEAYARNDAMRCFHCKAELYGTLRRLEAEGMAEGTVVLGGANADDVEDLRPGLRAGERYGVRNPLLEEGLRKNEVRTVARLLGLPVADKPALACLSSRVAFGIRITPDLLSRIDRAEAAVRALGFEQVRVRHLGDEASIEVEPAQVSRLATHASRQAVTAFIRGLGWKTVRIDPDGYRQGNLNAALLPGA